MQREMPTAARGVSDSGLCEAIPAELLPARQRFRDLVVERIMTLETLRIRVNNRQEPRTALAGIIALSHKIAGVAGSVGFVRTGNLAAGVEKLYRDQAELKVPLNDVWRAIEPLVVDLMDELEGSLDD